MKKLLTTVLLALALCCLCAFASAETTTIMMYMCGTDLQEDCIRDMEEMMAVQLPDSVRVIVQAGGASEWSDSRLTPNALNRFEVGYGEMIGLHTAGNASMGDWSTLVDYVSYCVDNYPADRYGLILWDHGGGSTGGICYDQTADDDFISIADYDYALYQLTQEKYPGMRFDFLGCDACMMASYEMAVNARYYGNYYVASEELEPGSGWYYTPWLQALADDPDIPTDELCKSIASNYYDYCIAVEPNGYLTISVIDLELFEKVVRYMEDYSTYLAQAMNDGHMNTISRVRSQMYAFGTFSSASSDMVDMEGFVSACQSFAPNTAKRLLAAIDKAVIYEQHNEDMFDYACGLSILLPHDTRQSFNEYVQDYDNATYIPNYTDFLNGYMAMVNGGSYNFSMTKPTQEEGSYVIGEAYTGFDSMLQTAFIGGGATNYEPEELPADEEEAEEPAEEEAEPAEEPTEEETEPAEEEAEPAEEPTEEEAEPAEEPAEEATEPTEEATEPTGDETESTEEEIAVQQYDPDNLYAYSMTLSDEDLANLSYVEGKMLMGVDDGSGTSFFLDLGQMQNAWVDWEANTIYSMFDGTWPTLSGQLVVLYDQVKTEKARRSVVPVKVNDADCYLLVVFTGDEKVGHIRGYSVGYDENGLPVRDVKPLSEGDVILPVYTMYLDDENGESQEVEFSGDPITYTGEELTITYDQLTNDNDDETTFYYCFCLNDIFGDFQLSEMVLFE